MLNVRHPPSEEGRQVELTHNALVGRVCLAWNQAHYAVYHLFETLTGATSSWEIFWTVKADSAQRDITLAAANHLLQKQPDLLTPLKKTFSELGGLAGERNAIVHTPFATTFEKTDGHPSTWSDMKMTPIKPNANLKPDLNAQVDELEKKLEIIHAKIEAIDSKIHQRLASVSGRDPRQQGLPKASSPVGGPRSPSEGSARPLKSS